MTPASAAPLALDADAIAGGTEAVLPATGTVAAAAVKALVKSAKSLACELPARLLLLWLAGPA